MTLIDCKLCLGTGWVLVADRGGYHLQRQCPACKGDGQYEKEA